MFDQGSAHPQETPSPTMRELATVLFRQGKLFVGISGIIFVLALVYAFAGTSYRAHVRILVRKGRSDPPATAQPNAPPDFSRVEVTEEELNSEVELLKDEEILRRVARENGLSNDDWLRWIRPNETEAARVERAARKLAGKLNIEPLKKTNLISVSYESSDANVAAQVLRSLANNYLEKHMEVHRPSGQLHFFDQQTAESRQQLDEAQRKLVDFTSQHRVVVAAQQRDLLLQRLDNTDANFRQDQVEIFATAHRVEELQTQLTELPERITTQVRSADNPELLRSLKASLLELELKRTQLLTKFEPSHRFVQEVDEQISQAQAAIAAERRNPLRDETTDRSPNYEWAKAELEKAQVEMAGLKARESATRTQLNVYRIQAGRLGADAITQDDLTSSAKAAEENYLLYVKRREEARVSDALDQGGIVNVVIAEPPVVPALPKWPAAAVLMVGVAAALTSGTAAAFAADHMDPALRTPEEVLSYLEIPVLASLPDAKDWRLSA